MCVGTKCQICLLLFRSHHISHNCQAQTSHSQSAFVPKISNSTAEAIPAGSVPVAELELFGVPGESTPPRRASSCKAEFVSPSGLSVYLSFLLKAIDFCRICRPYNQTLLWWLSECRNKAGTQFHFFGPAMLFRRLECQMLLGCSSWNGRTLRTKEDWQKTKALTIFGSSGIILCLHSCSSVTKPSKSFVPCKPLFEYKWSFNLATYRTRKINLVQVQMIWNIILHINYKYII